MPQRARRLRSVSPSPGITPKVEARTRSPRYEGTDSDGEDRSDDPSAPVHSRSTQPIRGRSSNFLDIPAGGFTTGSRDNYNQEPSRAPSRNRSRSPAPQVARLQARSPGPYQEQSQIHLRGIHSPISAHSGYVDRFNNQQNDGGPSEGSTSDSSFSMADNYEPRRAAPETTSKFSYDSPGSFVPSTAPRTPQLAQNEFQPYDLPQVGRTDRRATTKITENDSYGARAPDQAYWAENIRSPLPTNRPPPLSPAHPAQSFKEPVRYQRQDRAPSPQPPPIQPPLVSDAATLMFRTGSGKPGDHVASIYGNKQSKKAPASASVPITPVLDSSTMSKADVRSRPGNQITRTMGNTPVPSYPPESRGQGLNPDRPSSPPTIIAPPPSPSTTRRPTRQRSTSNLKPPTSASGTLRPRAKSASEERPPPVNPVTSSIPVIQKTSLQSSRVRSARLPEQDRISLQPSIGRTRSPSAPLSRSHLNPNSHPLGLQEHSNVGDERNTPPNTSSQVHHASVGARKASLPSSSIGHDVAPRSQNETSRRRRERSKTSPPSPAPPQTPVLRTIDVDSLTPSRVPHHVEFNASSKLSSGSQLAGKPKATPANPHQPTIRTVQPNVTLRTAGRHDTPEGSLDPGKLRRLSMLHRISTSPSPPEHGHGPRKTNESAYLGEQYASPEISAPDQPLFLSLSDALSRPYSQKHSSTHSYAPAPRYAPAFEDPSIKPQENVQESDEYITTSPVIVPSRRLRDPDAAVWSTHNGLSIRGTHDLTSVASDLSSLLTEEHRLSDGDTSISGAAEELFKSLSIHGPASDPSGGKPRPAVTESQHNYEWDPSPVHGWNKTNLNNSDGFASEAYPATWRETFTDDMYQALLAHYDIFEMRRQEMIWELCRSEDEFVHLLHTMLKLFVTPLRAENDTRWIPGLDADIARLFDWLDDIAQLHGEVLAILEGCRNNQLPIVIQIGESLRPFVSRLEFYQPYIVRVDDVSELIRRMVLDPDSDFGEFVRIQTESADCPGSLLELLQRPVERLGKYPSIFKQIFSLTPRSHPDHLSMFSLLHGTDMMIRVLQGVKKRETEYEAIKILCSQLQGIPADFQLASRERRLIGQGPLLRVYPEPNPDDWGHMPEIDYTPSLIRTFDRRASQSFRPQLPGTATKHKSASRPSVAKNVAHHQEDRYRSEAPSVPDFTSSSSENRSDPLSYDLHQGPDSTASSPAWRAKDNLLPHGDPPPSRISAGIYAFVFTDVVVLTKHRKHIGATGSTSEKWELLPDVGIARVLGFSDLSGTSHEHLIELELLPLDPSRALPSHTPAVPVYLSLTEQASGRMSLAPGHVLQEARKQWSEAFSRCYVHTMRSLAFPATYDSRFMKGVSSPTSIMSVLSSDRPLPKSPSTQLLDRNLEPVEQERQERDWWAARFQQVLEELSTGAEVDHLEQTIQSPPGDTWDAFADEDGTGERSAKRPTSMFRDSKTKFFKLKG